MPVGGPASHRQKMLKPHGSRRSRGAAVALSLVALVAAPAAASNQPGATALVREVEQAAASVRVELRAARDANDPGRTRCVSAKLSEVHAQLRLAEQQARLLASSRDVQQGRRHRYLLGVAHERAHELAQAARRCATARASFVRVVRR
ncbi:MAG: hypothetical protein AMXMBFR56_48180 [Polyangiaceae bacterium]